MTHGTATAYNNGQCRCQLCRTAWAAYVTARRKRKAALGRCIECARRTRRYRCAIHHARHLQSDRAAYSARTA